MSGQNERLRILAGWAHLGDFLRGQPVVENRDLKGWPRAEPIYEGDLPQSYLLEVHGEVHGENELLLRSIRSYPATYYASTNAYTVLCLVCPPVSRA